MGGIGKGVDEYGGDGVGTGNDVQFGGLGGAALQEW